MWRKKGHAGHFENEEQGPEKRQDTESVGRNNPLERVMRRPDNEDLHVYRVPDECVIITAWNSPLADNIAKVL